MMKQSFILLLIYIVTLGIPIRAHSMTFQFDRSKTGVMEFVESYVQFAINGKQLTETLPPIFYLVTERSEKETVIVAKVGQLSKNKVLSSTLSDLISSTPKTVKGPHGKTIFYHPMPTNMKLSAYTEWKEWLFISGNPDTIVNLLKGVSAPEAVVTPDPAFLSDGLPKTAPVRFWANNAKGNFTALIRENQPRSVIPLPKEPDAIRRFSGLFRLGPGRKIVASATAVPSKPKQHAALKKELELMISSSHQFLEIFKVPSIGDVKKRGDLFDLKLSVDDYLLGQPGLFKKGPTSGMPNSTGVQTKEVLGL